MLGHDIPAPLEVDPARRIFGLETEFGLHFDSAASRKVTPEEVAGHLFHSVVEWGRSSNVFLPNGSRLYIDVGAHPEYATAECDDLLDLIALDKAGERIVSDLVEAGERRLAEAGTPGAIHLYKNNTDSFGNSYGCHENYLVRRRADFAGFAATMLPFLVTRQIATGAGCVTRTPDGSHYSFSPRAEHMWEGVSSATTRSRPMINTRDEPHANAELYRRMHVIVGDSTMSESTALLKVGATDLVLRVLEARVAMPALALESDMRAIRDVAHDITGRALVTLADGRKMTAADIQETYLDLVRTHVGTTVAADVHTPAILDLWERAIDAVRRQNPSQVETELDWAIKLRLLTRYQERTGAALADPRIARLELAFHDVSPTHGLYARMLDSGQIARLVPEAAIEAAKSTPPATTRAALRGKFVQAGIASGRDFTVDWVHLKVPGDDGRTVLLKDPFRAVDDRVDQLIDSLTPQGRRLD